jgi:hypothetical protein
MTNPKDHQERLRQRAYELWEREGRPHGREAEHWKQAEAELGKAAAAASPTVTAKPAIPAPAPEPVKRPSLLRGRKPAAPAAPPPR